MYAVENALWNGYYVRPLACFQPSDLQGWLPRICNFCSFNHITKCSFLSPHYAAYKVPLVLWLQCMPSPFFAYGYLLIKMLWLSLKSREVKIFPQSWTRPHSLSGRHFVNSKLIWSKFEGMQACFFNLFTKYIQCFLKYLIVYEFYYCHRFLTFLPENSLWSVQLCITMHCYRNGR